MEGFMSVLFFSWQLYETNCDYQLDNKVQYNMQQNDEMVLKFIQVLQKSLCFVLIGFCLLCYCNVSNSSYNLVLVQLRTLLYK